MSPPRDDSRSLDRAMRGKVSTAGFSVVTVVHHSAPELRRLLASLDAHLPVRPEVIVVDSGSGDEGAQIARDWGAIVVDLGANRGFGAASNVGVQRASHDVTALLNPDVELLDDSLTRVVERAREHDALLAPRLLNADGSTQRSAHPLPGRAQALIPALIPPRMLPFAVRERLEPHQATKPRRIGWAIAAALTARTQTLKRLGPFDPEAFLFYEDLDLCLRAHAQGIPTELHPDTKLRHTGAHATRPAYGGEPHDLLARRRREVIEARLGKRARALDDAAQALTFATRAAARRALRRDATRETAQLRALLRARKRDP
jgi:N-acetylglucosaminyl-diphospho-decaprenol L-rhamnosyltransferase